MCLRDYNIEPLLYHIYFEAEKMLHTFISKHLMHFFRFLREGLLLYRQLFLYVVDTILSKRAQGHYEGSQWENN